LTVAGTYHSPLMAGAQPKLKAELDAIAINPPAVPVISNVTAEAHGSPAQIAPLLVDQVTSSVRWEESIRQLMNLGFTRFIELGPGNALTGFMRRIDRKTEIHNVADCASLEKTVAALKGE